MNSTSDPRPHGRAAPFSNSLVTTHLSAIIQGPIHFGLAFAAAVADLSGASLGWGPMAMDGQRSADVAKRGMGGAKASRSAQISRSNVRPPPPAPGVLHEGRGAMTECRV